MRILLATALASALIAHGAAIAQVTSGQQSKPTTPATASGKTPAVTPVARPALAPSDGDFVIGPEDVLGVIFWRDTDMTGDVTVRPDGMITLPLVRDIKAAGLTPNQLADRVQQAAREYVTDASVTVVVRQVHSRKAFITGEVARPGAYSVGGSMTVVQLIAVAGGITEFADPRSISVMRVEGGQTRTFVFDYKEFSKGRKTEQNIQLKPGDTVVVPER